MRSFLVALPLAVASFVIALPASADELAAAPPSAAPPSPSTAPTTADRAAASEGEPRAEDKLRRVYASISPIHLLFPVVEATIEARVIPKLGVAVIGGYGQVTVDPILGAPIKVNVWEAGGQVVGYPIGNFDHGMQVGAEVLYAGASTEAKGTTVKVAAVGSGLSTGGFIGYKLATKVGFTFNVQGGVTYLAARASGSDGSQASTSRVAPLANINVGWSF